VHSSIRAGDFQGTHVLRFLGDVRVTLCGALDAYCERMVKDPDFHAVVIDLEQTENLDSTALGCLARLSIRVKKLNQRVPTLICNSSNLKRILSSMGFHDVFMIVDRAGLRRALLASPARGDRVACGYGSRHRKHACASHRRSQAAYGFK
jgi:anti-anti-sigma factor